nr:hypothetical protein CFP56_73061 [Quercus suber]
MHLRSQDQDRGSRHFLSQDQIHGSQEPTYPRSIRKNIRIQYQYRGRRYYLNQNQTGTYVSKINIVVADITSVKIRFIGRRNLRMQDQYRGRKHYLSQDQIHWSQEPTYPRSISWS